jgi:hypothetical protein
MPKLDWKSVAIGAAALYLYLKHVASQPAAGATS